MKWCRVQGVIKSRKIKVNMSKTESVFIGRHFQTAHISHGRKNNWINLI